MSCLFMIDCHNAAFTGSFHQQAEGACTNPALDLGMRTQQDARSLPVLRGVFQVLPAGAVAQGLRIRMLDTACALGQLRWLGLE